MNERLDFKGRRAVVVNDDPTQLAIFSGLLRKEGLNVQFFMSAEEAIRQMSAKSPPHLIVSDIYMPGIDGWRFCRLLRSPEYRPFNQTPILVTSATFTGQDISMMTTRLGADAFLPSPVDGPKFLEVVRKLLSGEKLSFSPAVLIIEEDRDLADHIARAFEGEGYRPIIALTGQEGRRIFREESPGFIILAAGLADMKVEFLLREIRDLSPDTVVIVTASEPGPERALESLKRGAQGYAAKPLDPEDLINRCENAGREKALIRTEDFLEEKARALQERTRLNQILLDAFPCVALLLRPQTREIVASNAAAVKAGAVPGTRCYATWGKRGEPCPWCLAPKVWATGEAQHLVVETPQTVWDAHWLPVGPDLYMHFAFDITAQKRTEEAVQIQSAKAQRYLDIAPCIILALDTNGNITLLNEGGRKVLECEGEEIIGKNWFATFLPKRFRNICGGFLTKSCGAIFNRGNMSKMLH